MRRYPPLLSFLLAILIAALVLPSALNIPQTNPTEVAEFAPVPPDDDSPPPPQQGALADLGLGMTPSLVQAEPEPQIRPPDGPERDTEGTELIQYRCVGDPPRQTEDPNAPPCVPFWEGDNDGETWQGVTGETINVLVYAQAHQSVGGSQGHTQSPGSGRYCDVDGTPPDDPDEHDNCGEQARGTGDHPNVKVVRALSRYFNARYNTYGRRAHFWIYWSGASSPATRRADAHDNWETLQPFAVIDDAVLAGFNDAYTAAMTRRRTMVFGTFGTLPNSYYREYAPYVWGFWPDVERWLEPYVSYVCQKVAPYPVLYSGMNDHGEPRRYALMRSEDPGFPGLRRFGRMAAEQLREGCPDGTTLDIVDEVTFPRHTFNIDTHPDARQAALENVASMRQNDVTTVLWLGGYETWHSSVANDNSWYPEWVVAGDLLNDSTPQARDQNQNVWRHAWYATNLLREDRDEEAPCRMAYREADPRGTTTEETMFCELYRNVFMLFRGIQAAGPRLTPFTVEQGNHAIPRQASTSPYTAACYFEPGDYTCVKDMMEMWWDPDAPDPNNSPDESGCFRMVRDGLRSLPWEWRGDGLDVFANPDDVCNNVRRSGFINPFGPAG